MQDIIQREIIINATKEKVYEAIANPDKVVLWFPDAIEGKYAEGEGSTFVFNGHGKSQIQILEAKPYEYFAYRWVPGANVVVGDIKTASTTLVEFNIQEEEKGKCKVTMVESGFAKLPQDMAENAFKQNSGGWEFMLGRLEKQFV